MKKTVQVIAILFVVVGLGFSADAVKKTAPVTKTNVKEVPKDLRIPVPEAAKPAAVKSTEVVVDDFEAEKLSAVAASMMGDAAGIEETAEDKVLLEQDSKKVKTGKKSAKLTYSQNPANEKKFGQITLSSASAMGVNNAVSFYVFAGKGKSSISVYLYDTSWKKWISQSVNVDKSEWVLVTLKDSDFVSDTRPGKWENINKLQIIVKGSGVFNFDGVKFIKAAK